MQVSIAPSNITAAAVLAQFAFAGIAFTGAIIIKKSDNHYNNYRGESRFDNFGWITGLLLLVTLGSLLLSDAFSLLWQPLLNENALRIISWRTAITFSFSLDIGLISYLVFHTGGSQKSAFTCLYFLIPTLSILLRENIGHQLFYAGLAIALFSIFFKNRLLTTEKRPIPQGLAFWVISVASFFLTLLIAHKTRPF